MQNEYFEKDINVDCIIRCYGHQARFRLNDVKGDMVLMALAFQCDNLTCRAFLIAGKDLIFEIIKDTKKENRCLKCIILMKENADNRSGWFDVNRISLFDYPAYRSEQSINAF